MIFYIIGIDDNQTQEFSTETRQIIQSSSIFSGGARHHEIVKENLPKEYTWIDIKIPLQTVFDQYENFDQITVFASGDPLFYGFANTIKREFPNAKIVLYPHFNSLQTLAHRMVLPYHDMHIVSLTGRPWHKLDEALNKIDEILYSEEFEEKLKAQLSKFNKHFSAISYELYGEKYALKFEKEIQNKTNKPFYKFSAFNLNMSSGKKQGEILCFDLAHILFADEEEIPTLHFLLNDKKELMHDNQLFKVADFVKENGIQLVISMLKDKLPEGLINNSNVVVELSQESKLFKI